MHAVLRPAIADTAIEMGINPATDLKVRAGISAPSPAAKACATRSPKLGVQYCDVYGLSGSWAGVAFECQGDERPAPGRGPLLRRDRRPPTLQPVPDGEYGELVFTTLTRECCPLVRYRTRDITRIISEPCACGMRIARSTASSAVPTTCSSCAA